MKHLTGARAYTKALVPRLQHAFQHQFKGLQIQCTLKRGALQIPVEHVSSAELNPQEILLTLEQLVRDCAPPTTVTSGEQVTQPLPVQVSLKVAGERRAYVCHSFTVTLTTTVIDAEPEPTLNASSTNGHSESHYLETHRSSPRSPLLIESTTALEQRSDVHGQALLPMASSEAIQPHRSSKLLNPWVAGIVAAAVLGAGVSYYAFSQASPTPTPTVTPSIAPVTAVTALGRIEPQGDIIKLSVANAQDNRVEQLLVQEGDHVSAGQVIAILQGVDKKKAALIEAEQNVMIARARLAQVQSGEAKISELAAQRANIARLEAQLRTQTTEGQAEITSAESALRNAEATYQRYQMLYEAGATSLAEVENVQKDLETAQAQLAIAQAQLANTIETLQQQIQQEQSLLAKLSEVRPVDVQVVQAELNYALTQVDKAQAELEDLYVKVPIAGQILKINTRIGEQVDTSAGIVELAQTDQMYVIAEVYETDIGKIQLGQQATVVSENGGFEGEVSGTVDHIGLQIGKKNILDADPAAEQDARVVEVKIRIAPEDTPKVAGLTNMQVRARIDLD